ncbi:(3R)-3-[(carboxymethyl)amino]fatty acid oxygenase/decarboxylase [Nocardia sp. CDC160]|uniref:(3R)-3-[(carboxymethyl)amino]fatty acid oxygenase/decarboxylase n=1 Tax=Nocardia sp. CDC160 TaxID=3112166 RepID=UPI002DB81682|nr:TauD/TfdA family dioxygenase [Nocardia sp. CDC160]MEC3914687.1 TauD/TfdA family dioxygenase [Nocardia sp. CDC160]
MAAQPGMGVVVENFDADSAEDVALLKKTVYRDKIAVLRGLDLDVPGFLALGRRFGTPEAYYEPAYHHPEHREVFVSANVEENGRRIGVPKTGRFWHSDYQFMPRPFDLTLTSPRVVPARNRGTLFIDLARAYEALSPELKRQVEGSTATHTVRRYFKIRPGDVFRPLGELVAEVDAKTPPVTAPTVYEHPHTGERVLYISEGFTESMHDADGRSRPDLLRELLAATGQLDDEPSEVPVHLQTFEAGDVLVWDNRALVHRAVHTDTPEPAVSWRVTVHDRAAA